MKRIILFAGALALGLGTQAASAADERTKLAEPPAAGLAVGDLRRRLLLVHGAALRQARRRGLHHLGLHRRHGRRPELQGGLGRPHGPHGGAAGRLRPGQGRATPSSWTCSGATSIPSTARGQFCDKGHEYRPAVFAHDDEQKRLAEESKAKLAASGRFKEPIAVAVEGAKDFYVAEDYHQDYYQKNALKYQYYRWGCGRDARLKEVWGEPSS